MSERMEKRVPLACRLGFHRYREDVIATALYMKKNGLTGLGWPDGAGVLMRCVRCGKESW